MAYSDKLLDHYENPRNVGTMDKDDDGVGTGLVGAPACGDVMKLQIKVDEDGIIEDAKFKTFGCGSAIASSSLVTEWVKGKTVDEALWVWREIKALEEAGAYAVEVEVIPEELLTEISKRTTLITSSIGGGSGGDIQFLFADDILGISPPPYPRHSKQYRNLHKLMEEMQRERVAGFRDFVEDVRSGGFPEAEHVIRAEGSLIDDFLAEVDKT